MRASPVSSFSPPSANVYVQGVVDGIGAVQAVRTAAPTGFVPEV